MSEIQIITDETRTRLNALAIEVTGELLRAGLPAYSSMTSEPGAHVTVDSLEPRGVTIDWHCHDGLLTPMFEAIADNIVADDLPGPNPSGDWLKAISRTMETSITTRRDQRWRDVVNARHRQECALHEHDRDGETSG